MVEAARQGASGGEFDAGKMAQAAAEEFKDAAPAMYGMALLGIVPQAGARRMIERVKSGGGERNAPAAPENAAEPFGGGAAAEAGRQAEGAGGAGVWGSPEAGGQGGVQFGEAEAGGGTRQGGLQFGETGGSPRADYFIYGADGKLVGTSREPAILPTSGGIYYDSYASAFADAGRRGAPPAFSDGRKVYAILPVESDGRVFYYAAEYDPQAGRRNVELLENPPQGQGGAAGPEWLGAQMEAFIEKRRENPDAGPRPYASEPFTGADGVENVPINFARERVGGGNSDQQSQRPADNVRNAPESAALISPSKNVSESQGENYSEAFGAGETEDARAFRSELAEVEAGTLPTYKILKLGRPSKTLLGLGVPDRPISLRQSVIKKILEKHGLGYDLISKLPEAINDPIAIFSYPKNENVRDILLELRDKNGRAIMASLKLNVSTQRYGEVSDLATVHPKENIGRIYDWIKKGRLLYWDKQKGRKFLQDSALIKLEQYGTELSPLFPPSENASESQGGNLNFYAEPRVSEGRPADAGGGYAGAERGGIPAGARGEAEGGK